jgi:hypothetical protein
MRQTDAMPTTDHAHAAAHPRRWLSPLILSILALAAGAASVAPASAETERAIYRCIAAKGAVSYQDSPCAPEQRTTVLYRFRSGAVDSALLARSRAIEQEMDLRNRGRVAAMRTAASGAVQKPKPPSRCESAKSKREVALQRLGLKRDFDLMSALDRAVWDACRGF